MWPIGLLQERADDRLRPRKIPTVNQDIEDFVRSAEPEPRVAEARKPLSDRGTPRCGHSPDPFRLQMPNKQMRNIVRRGSHDNDLDVRIGLPSRGPFAHVKHRSWAGAAS